MSMSSWRAAQEVGFFGYPDDDPWCGRHDQEADPCQGCIEESEAEARMARESAAAEQDRVYRARMLDDLEDLPY